MDLHVRIPGPLQYLIHEQAKSIIYLQELQNEVGSLLEFRELVMSTFPQLQGRLGTATSDPPPAPPPTISASAPPRGRSTASARKAHQNDFKTHQQSSQKEKPKKAPGRSMGYRESENETSDELVQSTWSNSSAKSSGELRIRKTRCIHEGGSSGVGGSAGSAGVQDSGFSTETKEHHSSSTLLSPGSHNSSGKSVPSGTSGDGGGWPVSTGSNNDAANASEPGKVGEEDELWNLLDVIHRKSVRLRQEVVQLQYHRHQQQQPTSQSQPSSPQVDIQERTSQSLPPSGRRRRRLPEVSVTTRRRLVQDEEEMRHSPAQLSRALSEVDQLRKERHLLLERLNGLERVALLSQARTGELERRMRRMAEEKRSLEVQLRTAVNLKAELNTKIHTLHSQFVRTSNRRDGGSKPSKEASKVTRQHHKEVQFSLGSAEESLSRASQEGEDANKEKDKSVGTAVPSKSGKVQLGSLDKVLGTSELIAKAKGGNGKPDKRKISAVLQESSMVELQRQVLLLLLACEALRSQGEEEKRWWMQQKGEWSYQKLRLEETVASLQETNEDLQFKLQEQLIDLENAQSHLRAVERPSSLPVTSSETQTDAPWSSFLGLGTRPLLPRSPAVRHFGVQTDQSGKEPTTPAQLDTSSQQSSRGLIRFELALPSQDLPRVLGVKPETTPAKSPEGTTKNQEAATKNQEIGLPPKAETKRPSRIPVKPPSPSKRDLSQTPKHSWRRESLSRRDSSSSSKNRDSLASSNGKPSNNAGSINNKESSKKEAAAAKQRLSSKERAKAHLQVEASKPNSVSVRRRHPAGQHNARRDSTSPPSQPTETEPFQRKDLDFCGGRHSESRESKLPLVDLVRQQQQVSNDLLFQKFVEQLEESPRSNPIPAQKTQSTDPKFSWPLSPTEQANQPHFRFLLEWGPLHYQSESTQTTTSPPQNPSPPREGFFNSSESVGTERFPFFLEDPSMVLDSLENQDDCEGGVISKVPKGLHQVRRESPK